jgi:hypothetical protein
LSGSRIYRFDRSTGTAVLLGDDSVRRADGFYNAYLLGHARSLIALPQRSQLVLYSTVTSTLSVLGPGSPLAFSADDSKLLAQTSTLTGALASVISAPAVESVWRSAFTRCRRELRCQSLRATAGSSVAAYSLSSTTGHGGLGIVSLP